MSTAVTCPGSWTSAPPVREEKTGAVALETVKLSKVYGGGGFFKKAREVKAASEVDIKVRRGETKWVLKQAYRATLSDELVYRRKHGFDMPIDAWLRGPLRAMFESTVLQPRARVADLVNQGAARGLYRSHLAGVGRHGGVLWSLLVLARWAERYLGPSSAACGLAAAAR